MISSPHVVAAAVSVAQLPPSAALLHYTAPIQQAVDATIRDLMIEVERAHFRTVTDTGSNPNALVVWNALRRAAGLPALSKDDLPAWDGKAYVAPEGSRLLSPPAPVPLRFV